MPTHVIIKLTHIATEQLQFCSLAGCTWIFRYAAFFQKMKNMKRQQKWPPYKTSHSLANYSGGRRVTNSRLFQGKKWTIRQIASNPWCPWELILQSSFYRSLFLYIRIDKVYEINVRTIITKLNWISCPCIKYGLNDFAQGMNIVATMNIAAMIAVAKVIAVPMIRKPKTAGKKKLITIDRKNNAMRKTFGLLISKKCVVGFVWMKSAIYALR